MNHQPYQLLSAITVAILLVTTQLSAQNDVYIQINSSDGVHFIVTDPSGRRTGADPRGVPRDTTYGVTFIKEIPGAGYSFGGLGSLKAGTEDTETHEFTLNDNLPQNTKDYSLLIIGTKTCNYWVDLMITLSSGSQVRANDRGIILRDSTSQYRFTVNDVPGGNTVLGKIVTVVSIAADIDAMNELSLIVDQPTADKYQEFVDTCVSQFQRKDTNAARSTLIGILQNIVSDSAKTLTVEACNLLRPDVEQLLNQLPAPPPGLAISLLDSHGSRLTGGSLQYYEGAWKDAVNNNDGTFSVNTTLSAVSLRMTYAYGSQQKSNVAVNGGPVTFQTFNTQVKLQNSQGTLLDQGSVQYYAGAWRDFGTTSGGVVTKELLPNNYSFRMTYAFASKDKQQNIGANPTVVFNTVNASVQLKNSLGNLIDPGAVQYYAGAWRDFGATTNGTATKELLPNSYSFRMTYEYVSNDKTQDIGANSTVSYSTVLCTLRVTNSQGQLLDGAQVSYYSGAWRQIGSTANGQITKELLPANLSFRMSYSGKSQDKQQNLLTNSLVEFVAQ